MSEQNTAQELVIVRHGATEWSRAGRHTGRTDVPLSAEGRGEARRIGARLAGRRFSHVLTSPLSRAAETCALAGFGAEALVDEDLLEWDYGPYEGLTTSEIRATRSGWSVLTDGAPGGEDAARVGARVDRLLARLRAEPGAVLLFAHGHVARVLGARWLGLPPEYARFFALDTGSLSTLGYERETAVLRCWNDTAHLEPSVPFPKFTADVEPRTSRSGH
jgi:probable phosphoglycerate mutase